MCWAYEGSDDLRDPVVEFLAGGVAAGQRVAYTADADEAELYGMVAGLDGCDELLSSGALVLLSLAGTYERTEGHDPVRRVAACADLTRRAIEDGYRGFRVAAEATPLVRDPEHRRTFARFEQLVDRYTTSEPFAAMCAYDAGVLGREDLAEVACVHPAVHGSDLAPFQLYATGATTSALRGEVDGFCVDLLSRVLADLPREVDALDASELVFIDHNGLLALDAAAASSGGLSVVCAPPMLRRIHGLLGLRHLRIAT